MQDTPTFHPTNGNSLSKEGGGFSLGRTQEILYLLKSTLALLIHFWESSLRRKKEAEGGKGGGEEREKFTLSDSEQRCSQVTSGTVVVGKCLFCLFKFVTSNTF